MDLQATIQRHDISALRVNGNTVHMEAPETIPQCPHGPQCRNLQEGTCQLLHEDGWTKKVQTLLGQEVSGTSVLLTGTENEHIDETLSGQRSLLKEEDSGDDRVERNLQRRPNRGSVALVCPVEDCGDTGRFSRLYELHRHVKSKHGRGRQYHCPIPGCLDGAQVTTFSRPNSPDEVAAHLFLHHVDIWRRLAAPDAQKPLRESLRMMTQPNESKEQGQTPWNYHTLGAAGAKTHETLQGSRAESSTTRSVADPHTGVHQPYQDDLSANESDDVDSKRSSTLSQSCPPSETLTQPTKIDSSKRSEQSSDQPSVDLDDTDSVRTDGRNDGLRPNVSAQLASLLAAQIADELDGHHTLDLTSATSLLLDFSTLLDFRALSPIQRRASTFMRHRRRMIARCLRLEKQGLRTRADVPSFRDKIDLLWHSEIGGTRDVCRERRRDIDLSGISGKTEADSEIELAELPSAWAFLTRGPEYSWLISRMRICCQMVTTGKTYDRTRRKLIAAIGKRNHVRLDLDWPLLSFLQEQYLSTDGVQLSSIICVVGTATTAIATTCGDYVAQVWPLVGKEVLRALDTCIEAAVLQKRGTKMGT